MLKNDAWVARVWKFFTGYAHAFSLPTFLGQLNAISLSHFIILHTPAIYIYIVVLVWSTSLLDEDQWSNNNQ